MKNCRTFFFLLVAGMLSLQSMAQAPVNGSLPTNGRLDTNIYRNAFFGFNYFVPEKWVGRASTAKMPGVTDGFVLLQAKRKEGDALSSISINAVDLASYGGKLEPFLRDRYRLKREGIEGDTTINGVRLSKNKEVSVEPEMLVIGERTFYRILTESTGVTRLAMVTAEKGYALAFEMIVPGRYASESTTDFLDSLHALDFRTAAAQKN